MRSYPALWLDRVSHGGDRILAIDDARIDVASGLMHQVLHPRKHAIVTMRPSEDWAIAILAVWSAGAIPVVLDRDATASPDLEAKHIVSDETFVELTRTGRLRRAHNDKDAAERFVLAKPEDVAAIAIDREGAKVRLEHGRTIAEIEASPELASGSWLDGEVGAHDRMGWVPIRAAGGLAPPITASGRMGWVPIRAAGGLAPPITASGRMGWVPIRAAGGLAPPITASDRLMRFFAWIVRGR